MIVYILHVSGCFWYATTYADLKTDSENWVDSAGLKKAGMDVKYVASIYWATVTCTTVGYGDITPSNNYELAWAMVIIITGVSLVSYFLSDLSSNFFDYFSEKREFTEQMEKLNRFQEKFEIHDWVMDEVRDYYTFKHEHKHHLDTNDELRSLLKLLPYTLSAKLAK